METAYINGKPYDDEGDFFEKKKDLDIQDISFRDIEKTKLGRAIKSQIEKMENRIKMLQGNLVDLHKT